MRRSEALKQIIPYLEITHGHVSVGDRPHGMPRKLFIPMSRRLCSMTENQIRATFPDVPISLERHIAINSEPQFDNFPHPAALNGELTKQIPCDLHPADEICAIPEHTPDGHRGEGWVGYCPHCGETGPMRKTERGAIVAMQKGLKK